MRFMTLATVVLANLAVAQETAPATSRPLPLAGFHFTDVSTASGITFVTRFSDGWRYIPEVKGAGVAVLDFDHDGHLDLVLVAGSTIEREARGEPGFGVTLWRGKGDLTFLDATARSGIPPLGWAQAPVAVDVDGDGWTDLLFTTLRGLRLLHNDHGHFVDISERALPESARHGSWCTSAAALDVDGDGDLDLFVARYLDFDFAHPPADGVDGRRCRWKDRPVVCGPRGLPALHDLLLRNRGDGTFEDGSEAFGLHSVAPAYGLGVVVLDFDRDGRPDVFVANDMTSNHLWHNDGQRFADVGVAMGVAYSADGAPEAGMGVDAADLNGDGVEDLYVTNFEGEANALYLSSSTTGYDERSARAHLAPVDRPMLGFGCAIRDFDGDGHADILVANGHVYPNASDPGTGTTFAMPRVLHRGRPDGTFERLAGPAATALEVPHVSRGLAVADFDDDGDLDVVIVNLDERPTILRNDTPAGGMWIGLAIQGAGANSAGIGAQVHLSAPGFERRVMVRAQSSFESSSDPRVLFRMPAGLNRARVEVEVGGKPAAVLEKPAFGVYQPVKLAR